ncbi:maleylpyruvate isomerase family mycothiol-dependent enzyme [Catellatospora sp. KI3]|uniref:maleylpyruvate isomerase family mycothiol-dependent enzyme n=1 Tax=Catellatospora sp. KI3 TaxID=3041620 RepID=UPI0024827F1D|nr:maleylpyruvate isomerase family mycothiol-dependent enzyme [Catellatospora sp. KI3]MDI1463297.1 maleylpyruvate isomerase family mycothiol-dependent enzyme [Catellatospora sp. KI3]
MNAVDNHAQALVGPQLRALADALASRPASVADEPSLCTGWAVRHVVAHMTMAARYDGPSFLAELAAVGHDFGALSEKVARRDGDLPFDLLLADLRGEAMAAWAPPGGGAAGALSHAVIHGLDITSAIGLPRTADDTATRLVLDTLTTGGASGHFGVDPTGRLLRATDLAWEAGRGSPVEASAGDLILALAARPRPGVALHAR